MSIQDDITLVELCKAGNMDAFSSLVDRYRDAVFNLAWNLCGDSHSAEDIAQETFIKAYNKIHQYNPQYKFRSWLLGICANLARSRYRGWRSRRETEQAYADEETIGLERKDTEISPRLASMTRALASLPESLRAPLVLKYMEGLSVEDVARTLGLRLSAAKMRLARGRARMAELMRGKELDDETDTPASI